MYITSGLVQVVHFLSYIFPPCYIPSYEQIISKKITHSTFLINELRLNNKDETCKASYQRLALGLSVPRKEE
jgi:hypothetical protein